MGMWWKKKQFWGGLVGLGLLAYCVKDIRLSELQTMFSRLSPLYLALAVLSSFAFVMIRGIRWKLIVSPQKTIPFIRALTLFSAGQLLNSAMPALTGQVGRLILFSRKESLRKTFVFGTMVLEVLFDAISLVVFVVLASLVFPFPTSGGKGNQSCLVSVGRRSLGAFHSKTDTRPETCGPEYYGTIRSG